MKFSFTGLLEIALQLAAIEIDIAVFHLRNVPVPEVENKSLQEPINSLKPFCKSI